MRHRGDWLYFFEKAKERAIADAVSNPVIQRCTHCGLYGRSDLELIKKSYLTYRERFTDLWLSVLVTLICGALGLAMFAAAVSQLPQSGPLRFLFFLFAILLACAAACPWLLRPLSEEAYWVEVEKANAPETAAQWVKHWNEIGVKKLLKFEGEGNLTLRYPLPYDDFTAALHFRDPNCFRLEDGGILRSPTCEEG